jgi:hypothetical protein
MDRSSKIVLTILGLLAVWAWYRFIIVVIS